MANVSKSERREPLEKLYCIVCGKEMPFERTRNGGSTCSKEHSQILNAEKRRVRDATNCRTCNRPSTPEERALYAAWRRTTREETRGRKKKPPVLEEAPAEVHP